MDLSKEGCTDNKPLVEETTSQFKDSSIEHTARLSKGKSRQRLDMEKFSTEKAASIGH